MLTSAILLYTDSPEAALGIQEIIETAAQSRICVIYEEEQALYLFENETIDSVFCYLTSGVVDAVNFLNQVWERKCKTARFAIGSTIDAETRVRCALGAHEFLQLPFDENAVRTAIERSNAIKQFVQNERVASVLSRMRSLPSKPTIYLEVMRELRSSVASATSVARLISKDLGIATKLLQLANCHISLRQ